MALSAVLLPAPLGPIRPTMRPSPTVRSTPSSATDFPNVLASPRASMQAMESALQIRLSSAVAQQFGWLQPEASDGGPDRRPLLVEEPSTLALQKQSARA